MVAHGKVHLPAVLTLVAVVSVWPLGERENQGSGSMKADPLLATHLLCAFEQLPFWALSH